MEMKERVVVISGATGGLGRVAACQFAQAGASLALFSRSQEKLDRLVDQLGLPNERCLAAALDLVEPLAAQSAAEQTLTHFGRADILLHLVGGWVGGQPLADSDPALFESMLNQHAWSTFHLAQAFLPHFTGQGWGRVIVVSSPSAGLPRANGGLYAAAKAAQESLVLSIAQEVKGSGVTANILRVNTIDVEHQRGQAPSRENAGWTTPEEICAAVFYLCSPEAAQVNGARIPLYGSP